MFIQRFSGQCRLLSIIKIEISNTSFILGVSSKVNFFHKIFDKTNYKEPSCIGEGCTIAAMKPCFRPQTCCKSQFG
jgi:hypothetical protein